MSRSKHIVWLGSICYNHIQVTNKEGGGPHLVIILFVIILFIYF